MPAPNRSVPKANPQANAQANPEEDEPLVVDGPEDESFDEKYNKRMEFPIALVGAILAHVLVACTILFVFGFLMAGEDKSGVPVKIVTISGFDDAGEGSPGSGGDSDDPTFKDDSLKDVKNPQDLPELKEIQDKILNLDPSLQVDPKQADKFNKLDKTLQNMMLGNRQGSGPGKGHGYDGTEGTGPGGTGSDSTLGRNLRWSMRFNVRDGKDYLEQLRAVGLVVILPEPNSARMTIIPDLKNWDVRHIATEDDLKRLSGRIQVNDPRPEYCREVAAYLGLSYTPTCISGWIPKDVEEELAKLEVSYNNKKKEDISETTFLVKVVDGKARYSVARQTLRK